MKKKMKKVKKRCNINSKLPAEIIHMIVSKLPIVDLYAFCRVCKAWKSLVSGLDLRNLFFAFISHPFQRPTLQFMDFDPYKYLENCELSSSSSLSYIPPNCSSKYHTFYMANSCRGLLCYSFSNFRHKTSQVCIFNPITNQFFQLPPSSYSNQCYHYALGFTSNTMHYKIARLCQPPLTNSAFIDVFSFETPRAGWTRVAVIPAEKLANIAYFNGALYWVGAINTRNYSHYSIYRFDLEDYNWDQTPFPFPQPALKCPTAHLAVLDAALHLTFTFDFRTYQVWRLNVDQQHASWTKLFHFDFHISKRLNRPEPDFSKLSDLRLIKVMENGNRILCLYAGFQLILYQSDPTTGTLQESPHHNHNHNHNHELRKHFDVYSMDFFHFDSLPKVLLRDIIMP